MTTTNIDPHVNLIQFCIQYSSLALIYYDYFLTLEREILYVWKRPFHLLTIMYFLCRYALVANVVYLTGLINKSMGQRLVQLTLSTPRPIPYRSWRARSSCDSMYLLSSSVGIFGRIGILMTTLIYELLATGLLAYGCVRSLKSVGSLKEQKDSLVFLMLKEGLSYSGFVTIFTTASMILQYTAPAGSFFQRLLNGLTMPISGMMTARFLLHVREWQDGGTPGDCETEGDSSIGQFEVARNRSLATIETFGANEDFDPPHSSKPASMGAASNSALEEIWRCRSREREASSPCFV
ncbi:hypothetical protein EST38_g5940 [Candolleomyces aberdarensis]|uniref:DUF6533 domain-containing protein n=1 Tax=Candolleomyces aberdarensis TaxID=2316362 RepID=A0A4Q2DL93_9AGAR|nr:hypothetical protein EST38_g5940 [Candolleomyces aberdarensis]